MKVWWNVIAAQGHVGTGKYIDATLYVFEENPSKVLERCGYVPSLKRLSSSKKRNYFVRVPDVEQQVLSDKLLSDLNRFEDRGYVFKSELEQEVTAVAQLSTESSFSF